MLATASNANHYDAVNCRSIQLNIPVTVYYLPVHGTRALCQDLKCDSVASSTSVVDIAIVLHIVV